MDAETWKNLAKYLSIAAVLITIGIYINKFHSLEKDVNTFEVQVTKFNQRFNALDTYIEISIQMEHTSKEFYEGLRIVLTKSRNEGMESLMDGLGFTTQQASGIYDTPRSFKATQENQPPI